MKLGELEAVAMDETLSERVGEVQLAADDGDDDVLARRQNLRKTVGDAPGGDEPSAVARDDCERPRGR